MSNILIINAHQPYDFSKGKLNSSLVSMADKLLKNKGHKVKHVKIAEDWDVQQEIRHHQWADIILLQSPINWMGMPWLFKKYMDEVYTQGMDGSLCHGDGRNSQDPKANYGTGGSLNDKKYMISLTLNAPSEAFNDKKAYLFQGKNIDDLMFPMHMNFRFFGMQGMKTFACYDAMKNPDIEQDFTRFENHINAHF